MIHARISVQKFVRDRYAREQLQGGSSKSIEQYVLAADRLQEFADGLSQSAEALESLRAAVAQLESQCDDDGSLADGWRKRVATAKRWLADRTARAPVYLDNFSKQLLTDFRTWRLSTPRVTTGVDKRGRRRERTWGLPAAATCNKEVTHLKAVWQFAFDEEELGVPPPRKLKRLRESKKAPVAWSVAEVAQQIAACDTLKGQVQGVPRRIWWAAFLLVLYDTGGRVTAVMRSRRVQLFGGEYLRLDAEDQKQGADQVFRLHADTRAVLAHVLDAGHEQLFPWAADADEKWRTLRKHYRRILQACSPPLPMTSKDMFHKFRRTTATYTAAAGGEQAACDQLGHSGLAVTRRYLDPTKIPRQQASDVLPRPGTIRLPERQMRLF